MQTRGSMLVQEDYAGWKSSGFKGCQGKLLMLEQEDTTTHQIFFDDNADPGDDCFVDPRDIKTGEQIPYDKFIDMYVVQAHPARVILEEDYFIKMIE